jgi:hypothetical protein
MKISPISGRERGEENLARVRRYLAGLKAAGQPLPLQDGRANITAIAEASGVLRNVFYTNAGVKRLLAEFIGGSDGSASTVRQAWPALRGNWTSRNRRILQLEQELASVKAETEELRKRLAAAEQNLVRYKVIEEDDAASGPASDPVRISATVTVAMVYPGPRGGAIFSGRDAAGKSLRFIANGDRILRTPLVGEVWSLQGESRPHPKYGDQVHVEQAALVQPTGRLIIDFLLQASRL